MNQTKAIIKPAKAPHTFDNVKKILIRYSKGFTLSARASHLTSIKKHIEIPITRKRAKTLHFSDNLKKSRNRYSKRLTVPTRVFHLNSTFLKQ